MPTVSAFRFPTMGLRAGKESCWEGSSVAGSSRIKFKRDAVVMAHTSGKPMRRDEINRGEPHKPSVQRVGGDSKW